MAVTADQPQTALDRDQLVAALVGHFSTPPEHGHPIILRDAIGRSGKWSVVVIWDQWFGLPLSERTKIIYEANDAVRETFGVDAATATGLTYNEAISLGYLPYQIQTTLIASDPVSSSDAREAMIAEGAVATSTGLELRFATEEAAKAAYRNLQTRVPGPYWMLAEEVIRES